MRCVLTCETSAGATIIASFDFLQTGEQIWSIALQTENGRAVLSEGGAHFELEGQAQTMPTDPHFEYKGVYRHFAQCVRAATSDFDLRPLEIVADRVSDWPAAAISQLSVLGATIPKRPLRVQRPKADVSCRSPK